VVTFSSGRMAITKPKLLRMNDRADRVIAHYERNALSWDVDRRAATWYDKSWIDHFIALLPAGSSVLDVGCGGGRPVASAMVTAGIKVTGVDTSPTLLSLCRNRMPHQEWIRGDMRTLALGRRFGRVLAWDSFFHRSSRLVRYPPDVNRVSISSISGLVSPAFRRSEKSASMTLSQDFPSRTSF
jgi:SAM-dependent methyltransferase